MRRLETIRTAQSVARADRLKPQVLVVDDDPVNVALLEKHLTAAGYPVLKAYDGVQALKVMESQSPQILILDWVMPGMDGPAVCRTVRALRTAGFLYVIMLTVHSAKKRLVEAFDAGVDDFLTKPFDGNELMARLRVGARAISLQTELARRIRQARRLNSRLELLNGRLEEMAQTDDLTGLLNRRQATARLRDQWAIADRYDLPLSLLMIDIDDFKKINDSYGHATGDMVLREVAGVLRQTIRVTDAACRVGGEEFLVILPNENPAGAAIAAERIRRAVSARPINDGPAIDVTVSIGAAHRHIGMTGHDDLLRQADGALYAAKHSGKNQVYLARDEAAFQPSGGEGDKPASSSDPAEAGEPVNEPSRLDVA